MKHTPTPWTVGRYEPSNAFLNIKDHMGICAPDDMSLIAVCGPNGDDQTKADVAFILRAVNCHEELVALLKDLRMLTISEDGVRTTMTLRVDRAIAIAEGKS